MHASGTLPARDRALVQIVDAAMAEAARRSGAWLACRPGCFECCLGPFEITELDARRLRAGLADLERTESERAARVVSRARLATGGDDEPCPALDPASGLCDLYAARPITCRTFGPPMRCETQVLGVCELCFKDASEAEIAACEVEIDPEGLESVLLEELGSANQPTTVAAALTAARPA